MHGHQTLVECPIYWVSAGYLGHHTDDITLVSYCGVEGYSALHSREEGDRVTASYRILQLDEYTNLDVRVTTHNRSNVLRARIQSTVLPLDTPLLTAHDLYTTHHPPRVSKALALQRRVR